MRDYIVSQCITNGDVAAEDEHGFPYGTPLLPLVLDQREELELLVSTVKRFPPFPTKNNFVHDTVGVKQHQMNPLIFHEGLRTSCLLSFTTLAVVLSVVSKTSILCASRCVIS